MIKVGEIFYTSKWDSYESNHFINQSNLDELNGVPKGAKFAVAGFRNMYNPNELEYGLCYTTNNKCYEINYKIIKIIESIVLNDGMYMIRLEIWVDQYNHSSPIRNSLYDNII